MNNNSKFPVFRYTYQEEEGKVHFTDYTCIGWATGMPRSNWEWYAFEVDRSNPDDTIYFGFVMGFEDEFGYFSLKELNDNGIQLITDPVELNDLRPPIGWKKIPNE